MKETALICLLFFSFSFCTRQNKQPEQLQSIIEVEAHGYVVPQDSVQIPKLILAGIPIAIRAGSPTIVPTNTNIHPAGIPKKVLAGKPLTCIPGKDSILLPMVVTAIDSPFVAGIPEIIIAKDMSTKDRNPQNFSTYGKLQGLSHGSIRSMLQDRNGNLWFGTIGGGATKFDGKCFTKFGVKEGLANNVVIALMEDKRGNIWFGTNGGLSKYDGKFITNFSAEEGLVNNFVTSLLEDKSGDLWVGTNGGGLSKFNGKFFTNYTDKEGLPSNFVISLLEDKYGNLWFATEGGGVSKFDGKSFKNYGENQGLASNYVVSQIEDKNGNLWFGTYAGACKFDGKTFTNYCENDGLANNVVMALLEDKNGNIWCGTNGGGISKFDGNYFVNYSVNEGLANNVVISLLEDNSGNLWFGTYDGVSKFDGRIFTNYSDKEGLTNNTIKCIIKDKAGQLWIGTYGGGVCKYDGKSFINYSEKQGLANNAVRDILEDKSGNLWFGTDGGLSKFDGTYFTNYSKKDGLANNAIWSMIEDKKGNLWLGTNDGGLSKFDGKYFTTFSDREGLVNNVVTSLLEDKSGNIWIGTSGGVSKFDGKLFTNFSSKEGLCGNSVTSLIEDKGGNLWFSTTGGVTKFDGKNFMNFNEKSGLANNAVFSLVEDESGDIWFGTRFGLSKLKLSKLIEIGIKSKNKNFSEKDIYFKNYTYEDGFIGIGVNGGKTMCQANDGTIWIGANNRLVSMHPENMLSDTIAPNIQVTSIELFNESITWTNLEKNKDSTLILGNGVEISEFEFDGLSKWYGYPENLSLAYDNNFISFNFIGITMSQPKKVKYQYKLEGIDKNWSAVTIRTQAPYGNLPHGHYTFNVKAMNSEGYWSEPFQFSFIIRPPWWKTWWFRTLVSLTLLGSIWYYIKWRERKLRTENEVLEKTVEERTAVVVEQKQLIEEKHKEITDSINYAERIQRSFIATKEILDENLNDYFVLFKPKDVVSGDFYWATKLNNGNFVLATADSTGHGVPGAIMSLLNITSLEKAVETFNQPSDILNATRKTIIERLKKDGSKDGGKDGMDCSILSFDEKRSKVSFTGANNPVWIVRGLSGTGVNELIELEPDKMPVGKHDKDSQPFNQLDLELQKGDVIYALTDGYPDQFGGPKGKKFMYKRLKELLLAISPRPMDEQDRVLRQTFIEWKGSAEQVDDITIIGIRV